MVLPLADPRLDLAACPPVQRVVVLATLPRTGSNLLALALADTGLVGVPGEYLLGMHMGSFRQRLGVPCPDVVGIVAGAVRRARGNAGWQETAHVTKRSMRSYMDAIATLRTTPNGVFGIKVHASELRALTRHGFDLGGWGSTPTVVHLDRTDRTAQAVSLERAHQDGSFASYVVRRPKPPRYDERRLRRRLDELEAGAAVWERYYAERGIEPLRVTYEDLDSAYEATVSTVLDHLGFPEAAVPSPRIDRQRDAVNDEWVERLRAAERS